MCAITYLDCGRRWAAGREENSGLQFRRVMASKSCVKVAVDMSYVLSCSYIYHISIQLHTATIVTDIFVRSGFIENGIAGQCISAS
jgi:hypothetical protein